MFYHVKIETKGEEKISALLKIAFEENRKEDRRWYLEGVGHSEDNVVFCFFRESYAENFENFALEMYWRPKVERYKQEPVDI